MAPNVIRCPTKKLELCEERTIFYADPGNGVVQNGWTSSVVNEYIRSTPKDRQQVANSSRTATKEGSGEEQEEEINEDEEMSGNKEVGEEEETGQGIGQGVSD